MSSEETKMEFFEVGDKTSLICADPATTDELKTALRDLGYKYHTTDSPELGIDYIRYTPYDVIVIHENFAGSGLRTNAVLNYLTHLPMPQRRNSLVCIIGPSFKTLDALQAFGASVHLVINPVDLPNFTAILKKGLAEFDLLYHAYREIVATQGPK
jgi:hypothetical protein